MEKSKRRPVIAGNWKMNMTPSEAEAFINELKPKIAGMDGCEIVVCVPDVDISTVKKAIEGSQIKLGAQNAHWEEKGAFTGETSAKMLKELGVEYVIIGHSERRQYFGEINRTVNSRVKALLKEGLKPILCVGELEMEYDYGITAEIVSLQVKIALADITAEQMANIVIAYEPVWAIGTGRTPKLEEADDTIAIIRNVIATKYSKEVADAAVIQYGGSMNAKNAAELLGKPNVDGGLIGGASLKTDDFTAIIKAAQ